MCELDLAHFHRTTALAVGLVRELHPVAVLKQRAMELAMEIADQPPIAVAGVLRAVVGQNTFRPAMHHASSGAGCADEPSLQIKLRDDRVHARAPSEPQWSLDMGGAKTTRSLARYGEPLYPCAMDVPTGR